MVWHETPLLAPIINPKLEQMIRKLTTILFLVAFSLLNLNQSSAQNTEVFLLVRESSSVNFQINSGLLPLEGLIQKFTGRISKRGTALSALEISVDCALSSMKFRSKQLEGISVDQLLASVKSSNAIFTGKPVQQRSDGSYTVAGTLKVRGRAYDVKFPVRIKENPNEIQIEGKVSGDGEGLTSEYPVLEMFQVQSAAANGKLVFRRVMAKSN